MAWSADGSADIDGSHSIARQLRVVHDNIGRAAERVGRQPSSVRLIVVTKGVPVGRVQQAVEAGARCIGENRLQEALPKITALSGLREDLSWHFLGRLQRRKVKAVVGTFEMIHSVDRLELAAEIDQRAKAIGAEQPVLLEVNLGEESSKTGFRPSEVADVMPALDAMTSLRVVGLMAIPPYSPHAEAARPYFRELRELTRSLAGLQLERVRMNELSMGMSHDYEIAVEEGATMVRVGTAIFGARDG
ncbi:MAG: YggS family pyridoxal phosphate-dependent enzyme [Acidimicrobiia bacterium]